MPCFHDESLTTDKRRPRLLAALRCAALARLIAAEKSLVLLGKVVFHFSGSSHRLALHLKFGYSSAERQVRGSRSARAMHHRSRFKPATGATAGVFFLISPDRDVQIPKLSERKGVSHSNWLETLM
jgi:hypothetical protein